MAARASAVLSARSISACHSFVGSMSLCATKAAIGYFPSASFRLWAEALFERAWLMKRRKAEAYQKGRLQTGVEGRTVNIEVATLRQVLKANDLWQPLANKVRMLKERHDVGKALTPEQERSLLQATAEADSACHTATVLALNTTMRRSEIRLLRWEQVDLEKRVLDVGKSKTEAGEGRPIPLNVPAFEALLLPKYQT
jgi:integrase